MLNRNYEYYDCMLQIAYHSSEIKLDLIIHTLNKSLCSVIKGTHLQLTVFYHQLYKSDLK